VRHDCAPENLNLEKEITTHEFHFGDYTLDQARYRLQRGTRQVRLEKLPMELLILLVERQGELVSREEIAGRLWGKDVFLDVDHSINTAVRKIRLVLRDDPEKPRYIETVVGKGYRFAAPVTYNGSSPVQSPATPVRAPVITPALPQKERKLRFQYVSVTAAVVAVGVIGAVLWLRQTEYFWKNPIANARFLTITDFEGVGDAAALSRDGHFVAFLSNRDGQTDVWLTQVGSGEFHNLTHGSMPGLSNPLIRNPAFSPDGSLVTFWSRKENGSSEGEINIWAVPTLGGEPKLYLQDVGEFDWSRDGSRLAYHTPGPGDPMYVSNTGNRTEARQILSAPAGQHCHFPLWSPDSEFIYFIQGSLPDKLDIWRIPSGGGSPERITFHNGRVTHPVFLNHNTIAYLATDTDGSGPWVYSVNVNRRISHRLTFGPERYTSLAASVDGRRLVATLATSIGSLWRVDLADLTRSNPAAISLTTSSGFAPRLGPDYLLYASTTGERVSIWKIANGATKELWNRQGAISVGGPAISADGRSVAFAVKQRDRTLLYVMQTDGTGARVISDSLELVGDLTWAPDGKSITVAVNEDGVPHIFGIFLDQRTATPLVHEYSLNPSWSRDGRFVVYSGPDIGTTFAIKAANPDSSPHSLPSIKLARGARHIAFLADGRSIAMLRGDLQHKDLWSIDLKTGSQRQLTRLAPDFDVRDFDISPNGRELVLERVQERSSVVLLDLSQQ
jgi:Tol biopolymer transport system component